MVMNRSLAALAVTAAIAGMSSGVQASGFQLVEQNASGLGNAYAGQAAAAQDASTIFWNPAGMTRVQGRQFVGAIHGIRPKSEFTNTATVAAPFQPLGGNGGDAGDWAFVPNAYFSWQLDQRWFVGLGLNAPFGLKTEYDTTWAGRYHAVKSELKTYNVNPSVAFKVSDQVSLGAGLNWQRADATLSSMVNYSGAAFLGAFNATIAAGGSVGAANAAGAGAVAAVAGQGRSEGLVQLDADDNAWGFNLGALFTVGNTTRIGVTYRSAMKYDLSGTATFANVPVLGGPLTALGAGLAAQFANGPVHASIKLPATASWSIFHPLGPKWDLMGDISWTQWSSIKSLDVYRSTGALLQTTPLSWSDTWRFSAGANYHMTPQLTWRFGVAFDQTPVHDADRTPRIPDNDRTWVAVGFQYQLSKSASVDFGYAHLFIKDPTVNLCNAAQVAANPVACQGKNNLVGTYDSDVNILSAQFRYSF